MGFIGWTGIQRIKEEEKEPGYISLIYGKVIVYLLAALFTR